MGVESRKDAWGGTTTEGEFVRVRRDWGGGKKQLVMYHWQPWSVGSFFLLQT